MTTMCPGMTNGRGNDVGAEVREKSRKRADRNPKAAMHSPEGLGYVSTWMRGPQCGSSKEPRGSEVDRLPYFGGRSFQQALERSTHRIPSRVRRSSALGLPLRLCCGSSGAISPHCLSPNSSSFTSNPSSRGSRWSLDYPHDFWDWFIASFQTKSERL